MIRNPIKPVLNNPTLLDTVFNEIGEVLQSNIPWLTTAYGKVQKVQDSLNGAPYSYPGIYVGSKQKKDYLNLLPDEHLGNYSFFYIPDAQDVVNSVTASTRFDLGFTLVFWFDYRKVYPNQHERYTIENIKEDILNAARKTVLLSSFELTEIVEEADNIYQGFTHNQITRQFLKRPYGGLAFNGNITYTNDCRLKQTSPNCLLDIKGSYNSISHASTIGGIKADEYYSLSRANVYGLPEGMVLQMLPSTSYANDAAAISGGIKNDQCFALSSANVFGLPEGVLKIIPSQVRVFNYDTTAALNGVPINGLYAVSIYNNFGLTKGIIKKRII